MYQIRGSNAFDLRDASSAWETQLHKIAARYLRGPFVIDFIAVGSSAFDIVALVTPASEGSVLKLSGAHNDQPNA